MPSLNNTIQIALEVAGLDKAIQAIRDIGTAAGGSALVQFSQAMTALGGNRGAVNTLLESGRLLGFNAVALGNQLQAISSTPGLGMAAAASLGIGPQPLATALSGTPIDKAGRGVRLLEALSDVIDRQGQAAAVAKLQLLGLDEQLGSFTELTSTQRHELIAYSRERAKEFTPELRQQAFEMQMRMLKLKDAFTDLGIAIFTRLAPAIDFILNAMTEITNAISGKTSAKTAWSNIHDALDKTRKAIDSHAAAINENTAQLRTMNGVYGGGARARGAIPGGFANSTQAAAFLQGQAVRFGAYAIGL